MALRSSDNQESGGAGRADALVFHTAILAVNYFISEDRSVWSSATWLNFRIRRSMGAGRGVKRLWPHRQALSGTPARVWPDEQKRGGPTEGSSPGRAAKRRA